MFPFLGSGRKSVQSLLHLCRKSTSSPHLYCLYHKYLRGRHHTSLLAVRHRIQSSQFQELSLPSTSRYYSSNELLAALTDEIHEGRLSLPELPEKLECLVDNVYAAFSSVSWIHYHNQPIALMQLLINEKLDQFMAPIHGEPGFGSLLKFIDDNLDSIPDRLIPRYLYCILFLGVDKTNPLIHKMLFRLYDTPEVMDMKNVATITECIRIFPRGDFKIWKRISSWLGANIDDNKYRTSIDIHDLSRAIINMRQLSSPKRLHSALELTRTIVKQEHDSLSMLQLGSALRLFRHLTFHVPTESRKDIMESVQQILNLVTDKLPEFQCHNFADICHMLKVMNFYTPTLMTKFQKKALEIFDSQPIKISELVNLCYVFDKNMSLSTRHKIESSLFQNMHEADILLLSNIADILSDIDCTNTDVISVYQELVLANIQGIQKYITRFFKIFRFLNRSRMMDSALESAYYNEVIKLLNSQQGISIWTICTLSSFLLPISKPVIPDILMNKLLRIIPQCDINNLALILFGLNRMKKPWVRQMYSQVLQLQTALHQNMNSQLHKVTNVDPLIQMIQVLYLKSEKRELALLENIMTTLDRLTHTLTPRHFRNIVSLFSQLRYYSPHVMNDLVKYAIDKHEDMNFQDFSNLVRILSFIGYQPEPSEMFEDVCIKMLDKHIGQVSLQKQLGFTHDLCQMQILPDDWLASIFTLKYIEMIDDHIEAHKESRYILQKLLMLLNRTVVLECPHLDIPWFHEEYCQKNMPTGNPYWMHKEINMILEEVLGGENFFQSFVHTPYYLLIDYEVILTTDKKVLKPSIAKVLKSEDTTYQRIAIIVLMERNFSLNNRNLLGSTQLYLRQLEMLGYKTVTIPYFDWNSMALTEWTEKVDFLRKKIFS